MTKLSSVLRAKAIEHKELVDSWSTKELAIQSELQKPEERLSEKIAQDTQFSGIVSLGIGKEFHERTKIAKKDIDRFALIYSMGRTKLRAEIRKRLIPVMKRGYEWESPQSRRLRKSYMEKADLLFTNFDNCELNSEFFQEGAAIEISEVLGKTLEHLEFCSAAGLVDKKPRARKNGRGADGVYFQEFYNRGTRIVLFGVFDGLAEGKEDDSKAAPLAIRILKEYSGKIKNAKNPEDIKQILTAYANEADATISESMNNLGGVTASIGVVVGKSLTYMNIGDSRIYAVSLAGVPRVKKITTDDGISGAIDAGASIPVQEFMRESTFPYLYLGSFSQQINGRYSGKRVLHQGFSLRSPNIGTVELEEYDLLLGMTDGIWKHMPMMVEQNGTVADTKCEIPMAEVIRSFPSKKPKDMVESIHKYAKLNMSGKPMKIMGEYSVLPSSEDIGLLAVSI